MTSAVSLSDGPAAGTRKWGTLFFRDPDGNILETHAEIQPMTAHPDDSPRANAHWGALASLVVVTGAAAFTGAIASARAGDFYQQLSRPAWAPPAQVFGPVWTALYVLMAVAAWLVVREWGWPRARPAIMLYLLQLVLNALWTWLFFRWHLGWAAMVEILALWALLLLTVRTFWRVRRLAGGLLVPYLAWVTLAAALTYAVWRRNPGVL